MTLKGQDLIKAQRREIARLKNQIWYLSAYAAELESKAGARPPHTTVQFHGREMRLIVWMDAPLVLANDVIAAMPAPPRALYRQARRHHPGPMVAARLRRIGLGSRELLPIETKHLSDAWRLTEKTILSAFGVSTKTRVLAFVTPLGIETLDGHAPGIRAWFAEAVKQLPNC